MNFRTKYWEGRVDIVESDDPEQKPIPVITHLTKRADKDYVVRLKKYLAVLPNDYPTKALLVSQAWSDFSAQATSVEIGYIRRALSHLWTTGGKTTGHIRQYPAKQLTELPNVGPKTAWLLQELFDLK